jgi:sialidase-1
MHAQLAAGKLSAFVLALALGMGLRNQAAGATEPLFEETVVFAGGQDGINTYRIPALLSTSKGTVLAFCEGRRDSSTDGSPTHLVLKRSVGNEGDWHPPGGDGRAVRRSREWNMTWQPMQILLAS